MRSETGTVVWLTGLPSSGKSTIAEELCRRLEAGDGAVEVLDSDALRAWLTPRPLYTDEERDWFYGVIVRLASMLAGHGVTVLIAATAPRRVYRESARARVSRFVEVYVECPVAVCRERDPKGLWRAADSGVVGSLPGAGSAYEPPDAPEVRIDSSAVSVEEAAGRVLAAMRELGA